jgi:hypothetical protein
MQPQFCSLEMYAAVTCLELVSVALKDFKNEFTTSTTHRHLVTKRDLFASIASNCLSSRP